jgi:hypothetical protein
MSVKRLICAALFLVLAALGAPCQSSGGLVAGGGLTVGAYTGWGVPYPFVGISLSAGWELPLGPGSAVFALEAGYAEGTSSYGGAFKMGPLALAASYLLRLGGSWVSLEAAMRGGMYTGFRPDVVDLTPLVGARAGAEARERGGTWAVYLRGGSDFAPEPEGLIILPALDFGLRFYAGGKK